LPLFAKEGIIPPFGKGRIGGILQNNVVIILRLLVYKRAVAFIILGRRGLWLI